MKIKCFSCGTEKDQAVLELFPYPDGRLRTDKPIEPLHVIECGNMNGDWRAVVVCHACIHKLEPDMWIDERSWMSMNPQVPFAQLPPVVAKGAAKWDPVPYAVAINRYTA